MEPLEAAIQEAQQEAAHARMLRDEHGRIFRELASRAHAAASYLGAGRLNLPGAEGDGSYLHFFMQLIEELEKSAQKMDDVVSEECRELIGAAITRVFCNLVRVDPSFDFGEVLKPVPSDQSEELVEKVRGHVLALISTFRRKAPDEDEEVSAEDSMAGGSSSS